MKLQPVINTKYVEWAGQSGGWREGIRLELACGHFVDRRYSPRAAYTHARCEWCAWELRDKVRYVRRKLDGTDGPAFIPETPA